MRFEIDAGLARLFEFDARLSRGDWQWVRRWQAFI
jgi:hypothetical protein